MGHLLALLAEQPAAAPNDAPAFLNFMPLLFIGIMFYFLLILPARKQEKQRVALLGALKKNDKVVTSGGLIGIIASIKDKEDEVMLKVDESSNVKLRVTRSSIVRVLTDAEGGKGPANATEGS